MATNGGGSIIYQDLITDSYLHKINADGSGKVTLQAFVNMNDYSWSDDGKDILYVNVGGSSSFTEISSDGSEVGDTIVPQVALKYGGLKIVSTIYDIESPSLTPDEKNIVYSAPIMDDTTNNIYVRVIFKCSSSGGISTKLAEGAYPSISPDGKSIVYVNKNALYMMNLDGSGNKKISQTFVSVCNPSWSPDGKTIAFEAETGTSSYSHIFTIGANGENMQQLTNGDANDYNPTWSPDGTKIAFSGYNMGIYTMNSSDGSDVTFLVQGTNPMWSPAIKPSVGNDNLEASINGTIDGLAGNDSIFGAEGNEHLLGGAGNDTLFGNLGNDILAGNAGADSYILDALWGNDTVQGDNQDVLFFEDSSANDLQFEAAGNDLIISSDSSSLVVQNWFKNSAYQISNFRFSDTELKKYIINNNLNAAITGSKQDEVVYGLGGNDTIDGGLGQDTIDAGEGNDVVTYDATDKINGGNGYDILNASLLKTGFTYDLSQSNALITGFEGIWGGSGNDLLTGDSGDNQLKGNNGNDYLAGGSGKDLLDGGAGSDTLVGGSGNDTLVGGAGNDQYMLDENIGHDRISADTSDTLIFGQAGLTLDLLNFAQAGNDLLISLDSGNDAAIANYYKAGSNQLNQLKVGGITYSLKAGSDKAEKITGTKGNEVIYGFGGNDTIDGGLGRDTIDAGEGNDVVTYDATDKINGGNGYDILNASLLKTGFTYDLSQSNALITGFEGIWGGSGNDLLTGDSGDNQLKGNNGNDDLAGGSGKDLLDGGAGSDTLVGGSGNDTLVGGAGNDQYMLDENIGHDRISADTSDTLIFGQAGLTLDLLNFAQAGNDLLISTDSGNDVAIANYYKAGSNQLNQLKVGGVTYSLKAGSDKAEKITGTKGNEVIYGFGGNDTIDGGLGQDTIAAGEGNDIVTYDAADKINGGNGCDILNASLLKTAFTYDLSQSNALITGFEGIWGGSGNDLLTGDNGDNQLKGNNGNDDLAGGSGNDLLDGGAGSDTLVGGLGNDTLVGGAGNDQYILDGNIGHDRISADTSDTLIFGQAGLTLDLLNFAQAGNDLLISIDSGNDVAIANYYKAGSNQLNQLKVGGVTYGLKAGSDKAEKITGTKGNDVIYGFGGNDTIDGGLGNDVLFGGSGADRYVFTKNFGNDIIQSSTGSSLDMLDFSAFKLSDAAIHLAGNDLLITIGTNNLCIEDWGLNSTDHISSVKFSNGIGSIIIQ